MPCSLLLLLLNLVPALAEILRVNTFHELRLLPREKIVLNLTVIRTCPHIELYLASGQRPLVSRMVFYIANPLTDNSDSLIRERQRRGEGEGPLIRVDIDSPTSMTPPPPHIVPHECNFTSTMDINATIEANSESELYISTDRGQRFSRPRAINDDKILLMLPQFRTCCVVKWTLEYFSEGTPRVFNVTTLKPGSTRYPFPISHPTASSSVLGEPANIRRPKKKKKPGKKKVEEASMEEVEEPAAARKSWTAGVNEGWITSFLVFTVIICSLMLLFVVFGLSLFVCLQSPPKGAKTLYTLNS